ncbi:MAG TPA: HEAT repeat domain-containing protein [Longimicrobiaceae bacterium]|nr:HEAT repeat domain-containing protein [Longimicrobiaceae bacterium]
MPLPRTLPARALALLALATLAACWRGQPHSVPAPQRLSNEVRSILSEDRPSARFYRDRGRLERMGAEIEPVLVSLVDNPNADGTVRTNALLLLADRRSAAAVPVLRRVVLTAEDEDLRVAAVQGLQRFAAESPEAANAIRGAITDPARKVRLTVLQALDVEDVALIRALIRKEEDAQVRSVAKALVALAESRGAALPPEGDGTYRTTAPDGEAQVVFHPSRTDPAGVSVGALWVQLPGERLVPLAQQVEAVAGVVPAFFSQDRGAVVFEAEREVRVRDLKSGDTRVLGPGVAPRPIPFSDRFVYLVEQLPARRSVEDGTELTYEVRVAPFAEGPAEPLGTLVAIARADRYANASPVRWMVVGETPEGFVLRGEHISTFLLPNPFEGQRLNRPQPRRRRPE